MKSLSLLLAAIGILLIVIGWGVQYKQWYFLISGYNTMSKEEQAKVDIKPLAKGIAIMSYLLGVLIVLFGIFAYFNLYDYIWPLVILIIAVAIGGAIYSLRFIPFGSTLKKKSKASKIITVITIVGVAIVIYFAMQPTKFIVSEEAFEIKGMYGDEMPWDELTDLTLIEQLPEITLRTNGSAVGSKLKGHFKLKSGEQVTLFVDEEVKQFISFKWDNHQYFINEPTEAETIDLYNKIKQYAE